MSTFVWRDGSRLTPYMLYMINLLDAAFYAEFGVHLLVSSGIRTAEEQEAIFRERYTLTPNGRRVYDTRWWNGRLWYRISSAGTVAVPRTSNHEIQGSKAAVDLRNTGSDAGVTRAGTRRANWLRANAHRFGLVASGYGFGEPWHYDMLNIYNAVPSGGGTSSPAFKFKGDSEMDFINIQGKSGSHRSGQFAIYRGNADGKLYALRITTDTLNPMFPTIDNEGLKNLQKAMPFIGL